MGSTAKELSDREDGEIIEDEFEDISDNSIILTAGKCISPKEHLPEIYLSSVSEVEEIEKIKHQRYVPKRKKTHRKRKYSHRKTICIDSDSDEYVQLDRKLLRAAIHIDNQDCLRNSLHTRLKAMNTVEYNLNKEHDVKKQKESENVSSEEGDDDLIQLRLEALRTAVFNKFKHRKKIKCKEICESEGFEDIFSDISENINNKENASNNQATPNQIDQNSPEISSENQANLDSDTQNIVPQEEDEDVLRALLLASLSKKSSVDNTIKSIELQPTSKIKEIYSSNKSAQFYARNCLNTNPYKKMSVGNKNNLPLQHSKVQPIIININCDSDTEDEFQNKSSEFSHKRSNLTIETSVEHFLKEQRAKVEAKNTKTDEIRSDLFNKSSLKLLPKIKQIEYHNLLKKLHDAQKLKQKQKVIQNNFIGNNLQSNSTPLQTDDEHLKKSFNMKKLTRSKNLLTSPQPSEEIPDLRNEVRILHKVLKEIQTKKSERLQMQTKYTTLTPIVRKINEASAERKKFDRELGRLLGELAETKKKLRETHVNIANFVKELITQKEDIDRKSMDSPESTMKVHYTSTPLKDQIPSDFSKTDLKTFGAASNIVNNDNRVNNLFLNDKRVENCENDGPINIDKTNNRPTTGIVPKYTSPLDNIERMNMDDPFLIICPYDIDGKCKDPDCVYKHYCNWH